MQFVSRETGGALTIVFVGIIVISGIVQWIYLRLYPSVAVKKKIFKWGSIFGGLLFTSLFVLNTGITWALLPFAAVVAIIIFMTYRNTCICEGCSKTTRVNTWSGKLEYCPFCGVKFPIK